MSSSNQGTRLNKYLASCGVGSRRACDTIIKEGRVYVNSSCCTNMGTRVTSDDVVRVGRKVVSPRLTEVVLFNKPRGLVCSASDELGRPTIYSILPPKYQHLKNVGRLDMDSEGLLVLTNDGDLALKLTHPRQKIEKEYLVTLDQSFSNEILERLVAGVHTVEGRVSAKSVKRVSSRRVKIVLVTGVKRQIRIMFEAIHLKVTKLVRIRIGELTGNGLEVGHCHALDAEDVEALQKTLQIRKRSSEDATPSEESQPGYPRRPSGQGRGPHSRSGRSGNAGGRGGSRTTKSPRSGRKPNFRTATKSSSRQNRR